jgi:hypothetical protein
MMGKGRPCNRPPFVPYERAEKIIKKATFFVDLVASLCSNLPTMAMFGDIVPAMQQRLLHECESIRNIRREMEKLTRAYNRFVDLREQLAGHENRMQNIVAVLGPEMFIQTAKQDESDVIGNTVEISPSVRQLREAQPLWKAIRECLRVAREAKVREVQEFLTYFGIKGVNRQAIESALQRHPKAFRVVKRGRDKYISLRKGT